MTSPSATVTRKKRSSQTQPPTKKLGGKNLPRPPPPPRFPDNTQRVILSAPLTETLPEAFEHIDPGPGVPEIRQELIPPPQVTEKPEDGLDDDEVSRELAGLLEEWEEHPDATAVDMSKFIDTNSGELLRAIAPGQKPTKTEWHIIDIDPERPDLCHQSDNPYDFLPTAMLHKLIRFWNEDEEAGSTLTMAELGCFASTKLKKMLALVVTEGTMEDERKNEWIRAAMISVVNQRHPEPNDFHKSKLAFSPSKPGYSWVVFPMAPYAFHILERVRGALDPRSGTLVLFRPWVFASVPIQRVYAFGIHHKDDAVPFDVAALDYTQQMEAPLSANNIQIRDMSPAYHSDARTYCTKIVLGFKEGTTPFLINARRLTPQFWTGTANTKAGRSVEYKWPSKCKYCESEAHFSNECPWKILEIDGTKTNLKDCHFRTPGWTDPTKKEKGRTIAMSTKVMDIRPKPRVTRGAKDRQVPGKGKGRAADAETMDA